MRPVPPTAATQAIQGQARRAETIAAARAVFHLPSNPQIERDRQDQAKGDVAGQQTSGHQEPECGGQAGAASRRRSRRDQDRQLAQQLIERLRLDGRTGP